MYVHAAWVCGGCTVLHECAMYVVVTGNLSVCVSGRATRGLVDGETKCDEGDRCERG